MTGISLGDWTHRMEETVLHVLHRHGVPNAVELAEMCARDLRPVVNSIRREYREVAIERLSDVARNYLGGE